LHCLAGDCGRSAGAFAFSALSAPALTGLPRETMVADAHGSDPGLGSGGRGSLAIFCHGARQPAPRAFRPGLCHVPSQWESTVDVASALDGGEIAKPQMRALRAVRVIAELGRVGHRRS
jgi:hypothetical protein